MEQALANILEQVQKLYQVKSVYHDHVQEELAIRKTASTVAHQNDVAKIAKMDKEQIKKFLEAASVDSDMSADSVLIASSVINMANHPAVKEGKRYLDAVATIDKAKEVAATYEDLKSGLIDENAKVEDELKLMSNLSSAIVDGRLVDMDIYIPFFRKLLYADNTSDCLVAVTALVRKNAELLESGEMEEEAPYRMFPEQADKIGQYEFSINEYRSRYDDKSFENDTVEYIENVQGLLEKEKVSLEEAEKMLEPYPGAYEYLIWLSMDALLGKAKKSSSLFTLLEILEKMEHLDSVYQSIISKEESTRALTESLKNTKVLLYNAWVDSRVPTFAYQEVNRELLGLLDQLREGKDTPDYDNITLYEGGVGYIKGKENFVLFRKFPKNNTFVVTSNTLSKLDEIVTNELLVLISKSYSEMNNWILTDSSEYSSMLAITKQVEDYWESSNIGGDK